MDSSSPPLSLALIRQRYTPFGGAERFLDRAMGALRADGVHLTLLARSWSGEVAGLQTLSCNPPGWGRLWRDMSFACCVRRQLRRHHFDLVQSHERIAGCDLYRAGDGVHRVWLEQRGRTLGWPGRLATAWSPYHRYVLAAERRLFESSRLRAVICNSEMVRAEIARCFVIDPAKLHVIYSGVDSERFHPSLRERWRVETRQRWSIPPEAFVLLFVGSGFARKGVPILLEAMAQLPASVWLWVVGQDRQSGAMQRRARRLGLGQRVCFTGGQRGVESFYGAADGLVLPTLYDPFPNVALEGMAAGLPLVTSHQCGAADLIRHGENGLLGDALDRAQLVANIRLLQADPVRCAAMGRAARQTVAPLTLEAMSQRLLGLYQTLLQRG
ncbi:MAG: glycosyltransferase family 4 protein [Magnetococcales bacterium]|nr:glycosyltransferase family 4 protein [Magnetococcales bacterium]